jgi:hypothetical protein
MDDCRAVGLSHAPVPRLSRTPGASAIMTRTLILIRHTKSDWDDPGLDDHDRPLNDPW